MTSIKAAWRSPRYSGSSWSNLVTGRVPSGVERMYVLPASMARKRHAAPTRFSSTNFQRGYDAGLAGGMPETWYALERFCGERREVEEHAETGRGLVRARCLLTSQPPGAQLRSPVRQAIVSRVVVLPCSMPLSFHQPCRLRRLSAHLISSYQP
jgi:hypothetical protein